MNKRIIPVLLALLVLQMFTACKKENVPNDTNVETTVEATTEVTTIPSCPGTVYTPEGNDGNLDDGIIELQDNKTYSVTGENGEPETKAVETKPAETVPVETKSAEMKPTETQTSGTEIPITPDSGSQTMKPATGDTDYEAYVAMSGPEQQAFMESFDSIQAFFEWHIAAKAAYEAAHPPIVIVGDGINAEDLVG